jgi:hypothetical protein
LVSAIISKATPAGVTSTVESGAPKLQWEAVEGAATYKVERYVVNNDDWTTTADITATSTNTQTVLFTTCLPVGHTTFFSSALVSLKNAITFTSYSLFCFFMCCVFFAEFTKLC